MIAPDFLRLRVPVTENIAVALVEGTRARRRKKDKQGRIKRSLYCRQSMNTNITR